MPQHVLLQTPENVPLSLPLAGPASRARALLTDLFIQFLLFLLWQLLAYPLYRINPALRSFLTALDYAVAFLLLWAYHVCFEIYWKGQTPGKRLGEIRVVTTSGQPVDFFSSFSRNLLRAADFLPNLFLFGFLSMLFSASQQRLGDRVAGTLVIRCPQYPGETGRSTQ